MPEEPESTIPEPSIQTPSTEVASEEATGEALSAAPVIASIPDLPTEDRKTINRIGYQLRQAQREIERLKSVTIDQTREDHAAKTPDVEPQEADYADYGSYIKALTTFSVRQSQQESALAARQQQQQAAEAAIVAQFEPQITAARAKYEDFDDVVSAPIFAQDTQAMLMQSPHGAEIGYYLGLRPQEADAMNRMSPVAKARAIIALEQKIGTQQTKTVSTAPAPITPVTGAAGSVKDPDKMTTDEWMAWNRQQHLERLKTKPLV